MFLGSKEHPLIYSSLARGRATFRGPSFVPFIKIPTLIS